MAGVVKVEAEEEEEEDRRWKSGRQGGGRVEERVECIGSDSQLSGEGGRRSR
jgi:hypothetical protein